MEEAIRNGRWVRVVAIQILDAILYVLFLRRIATRRVAHALLLFAVVELCSQLIARLLDGAASPVDGLIHCAVAIAAIGLVTVVWPLRSQGHSVVAASAPQTPENLYAPPRREE